MSSEEKSASESPEEEVSAEEITVPCCSEMVHIAYRSKADDRLYMAHNRKWQEVRFFRAEGLRAFCAVCRHRVL